jgi:magnesium-transporting ATPase (P-type)
MAGRDPSSLHPRLPPPPRPPNKHRRSILFPREQAEAFISDSLKFILVMLAACMVLFVWAAVVLWHIGASPSRIFVRFLDMITVAVPPALPACLTIATVFSIGRLRRAGVFVTGPHTITVAGQLDVVCFDKTGTLTEQGLELQGIVPVGRRGAERGGERRGERRGYPPPRGRPPRPRPQRRADRASAVF